MNEQPPKHADSAAAKAATPSSRVIEVLLVFGMVAGLTVGLDALANVVPFIGNNLLTLVAAVFLAVPIIVLRSMKRHDSEYGLGFYDVGKVARWAGGLTLVTLIGFVPAFHIYHSEIRGFSFEPNPGLLTGPSDRLLGAPRDTDDGDVHIYSAGEWVVARWTPKDGPWSLRMQAGESVTFRGNERSEIVRDDVEAHPAIVQAVPIGSGTVQVLATQSGEPIAQEQYVLGAANKPNNRWLGDGASLPINYWWILTMFIVQLVLVALPEEFFYRGYLQERLSEGIGRKKILSIGPVYLTWPIVIVSALFAIGHLVIGWDPMRLLVFFPSLLFGFLRDRTDGISSSVVYHAACNMMVHLAASFYFPM